MRLPISPAYPYHVTARCINREWFGVPLPEVWSIMENYLHFISGAYGIKTYSFVLMPNHFHVILQSPEANLSEAMNYFMRETSRQIGRGSNRINHIYGGRFHRSLISTERYFFHAYKYIYRNPVRAGLCNFVQEYEFSTITGLLGLKKLIIPLEEDRILFSEDKFELDTLNWLNRSPTSEADRDVGRALRRQVYQLPKDKNSKLPSPLEEISLY